jgi:predicted protein tyrosine phosphatase
MIVVSSLGHLDRVAARHSPSHVLTLLSPDQVAQTSSFDVPPERHRRLYFHDITEARAGLIEPDSELIKAILDFGNDWTGERPLLIHCWAGISRSSAAAFLIACARNDGYEADIADELRRRAPFATPNRLMAALADDLLGRRGRMVEAVDRIGRGADASEGAPYEMPMHWKDSNGVHNSSPEHAHAIRRPSRD